MGGDGSELEQREVIHRLGERIKELTALHRAATLLLQTGGIDDAKLRELVELLPPAMQFPEITTAALRYDGKLVESAGHAPTPWMLTVAFEASDGAGGSLDVAYREERPFLSEEQSLLTSIAEMLRAALDRDHFTRALEEQNKRFNLALDTAGMGVWEWDVATNTTRWSKQIAEMTGVASGGRGAFHDLLHPEDRERMYARLARAVDGEDDLQGLEFRLLTKTGWRHMACSARIVREPPARATRIMIAIIDVTARRALEESLQQAQKVEALGQVAAGVAHDFNNILVIMLSNLNLVREEMPLDHELRPMIDDTHDAAERGRALTRQLLTFSRKTPFHPEAIDLSALVDRMEPMLARLAQKAIKVELHLDRSAGRVWADAAQLEQLVMNLVVNARDAMPSGGTVCVGTEAANGSVELVVRDTGTGMADEVRAHMFEPFFTTKAPGKGTGLGLAVVADVARRWQGDIRVDSAEGVGTTFHIRFPKLAS